MKKFALLAVVVALLLLAAGGKFWQVADEIFMPEVGQTGKDVVWVPTPQQLVETMLDMAQVTASDYVIDLGSGDGRIVIGAAKRGATALGIEYERAWVEFAKRAATTEGVDANARFEKADIFEYDFSQASVLTLFLLPNLNLKLRPKILDMKPGTRVVSNAFDMGDWEPDQTIRLMEQASGYTTAYLWIVPAKVDGAWNFDDGSISFTQKFQKISGTLTLRTQEMQLAGKLDGNKLSFIAGDVKYAGTLIGNTISGTHSGGGAWQAAR